MQAIVSQMHRLQAIFDAGLAAPGAQLAGCGRGKGCTGRKLLLPGPI